MILAIGNHEAGISAPPSIFGGRRSIPYYFKYFWHGVYPDGDDMEVFLLLEFISPLSLMITS